MRPSARSLTLFAAAECAALLGGAEAVVRLAALDVKLLRPLLYYQAADLQVHRPSADAALHYELAPGTRLEVRPPPVRRTVTVNSLGFRGRERAARKPKGVFRILCLGGSNTFGALVEDDETWPAFLEKELNARARGRFEVWNAGVSAYTLSQNVAAARAAVARYEPDLLVFQVSNRGRRPFLLGQDFSSYFDADPGLYAENLPLPREPPRLHEVLMRRWRFYRALAVAANRLAADVWRQPLSPRNDGHNRRAFLDFAASSGRPPIALLGYPGISLPAGLKAPLGRPLPALELRTLLPRGADREYLEIHPPARVYAWYARTLAAFLVRERLIPR
jgi:hypothetical protein